MLNSILLVLATVMLAIVLWRSFALKANNQDDLTDLEETGIKAQLKAVQDKLDQEKSTKDQLLGEKARAEKEYNQLTGDLRSLGRERDTLQKQVAKFQTDEEGQKTAFDQQVVKLDQSRQSLEDEKARIRQEDQDRRKLAEEQRDRLWNDHEGRVIKLLADLCGMPEYAFALNDKGGLPKEIPSKFKPDTVIEFLGQFIVFDAKASRSDNFQNYIKTQVVATVEKINNHPAIYQNVFFVVPTEGISELSTTRFYEQGYNFFVISPEALAPILAGLKKITTYEFAEQMDPQERENIIGTMAELGYHISFRNAADIVLAQGGVRALEKLDKLEGNLRESIEERIGKIEERQPKTLSPADLKRIIAGGSKGQQKEIIKLVSPKALVGEDAFEAVANTSGGTDGSERP